MGAHGAPQGNSLLTGPGKANSEAGLPPSRKQATRAAHSEGSEWQRGGRLTRLEHPQGSKSSEPSRAVIAWTAPSAQG
eukprot:1402967-Alexandrium_andersonii.AAC.1